MFPGTKTVSKPQARPGIEMPAPVPEVAQATSEKSAALRSYLTSVQSSQLTSGLLRQDGGGPDTPFTADMLARNFQQITFYNEYSSAGLPLGVSGKLRRWDQPIRFTIEFGNSVPRSQKRRDRTDVAKIAKRLSDVTGHPITVDGPANFYVLFVGEDDRADVIDQMAGRLPGVENANLTSLRNLSDDIYCAVAAYSAGPDSSVYTAAVAVIRAENPDLLRLACIHEELSQAMGLANDSPTARPSIFNDDDEFALLTNHDELLLQMLYDQRLKAGMTLNEATPIIRTLATELTSKPLVMAAQ
tara:strand:- start:97 stop:999 length:903 start_codon:yes stop_codon:yes gene_type:complete